MRQACFSDFISQFNQFVSPYLSLEPSGVSNKTRHRRLTDRKGDDPLLALLCMKIMTGHKVAALSA